MINFSSDSTSCTSSATIATTSSVGYTRSNSGYSHYFSNNCDCNVIAKSYYEEEKKVECLSNDVLCLWYSRSKESIEEKKKVEKGKLIDNDPQVIAIRVNIESANALIKEYGFESQISVNFTNYITKETKDKCAKLIEKYSKESEELDKKFKEIKAMIKMCGNRPDKEAEVLANYGVTDKPFGKLTV